MTIPFGLAYAYGIITLCVLIFSSMDFVKGTLVRTPWDVTVVRMLLWPLLAIFVIVAGVRNEIELKIKQHGGWTVLAGVLIFGILMWVVVSLYISGA